MGVPLKTQAGQVPLGRTRPDCSSFPPPHPSFQTLDFPSQSLATPTLPLTLALKQNQCWLLASSSHTPYPSHSGGSTFPEIRTSTHSAPSPTALAPDPQTVSTGHWLRLGLPATTLSKANGRQLSRPCMSFLKPVFRTVGQNCSWAPSGSPKNHEPFRDSVQKPV